MPASSSSKSDICAVYDPTSQHERADNSSAFDNMVEKLKDLQIVIEFVLQSFKKDDSSSLKGIGDFHKEFRLKFKKRRSASSAVSKEALIKEFKEKCSSTDRGGKMLKWNDVLEAAIGGLKLLSELPFAAVAVPSIFLVASLRRAETGSKNKMEAAEVISELKRFVDYLLALVSCLKGKMYLAMLSLMNDCVNVVTEGFWLCTSILIEGELKGWLGAPSNKESIEKLKEQCRVLQRWIKTWLRLPKPDADRGIKKKTSGAKIEKNSFKSEASVKTMVVLLSKDAKVSGITSREPSGEKKRKISFKAEALVKMEASSIKDMKNLQNTRSSQAANPHMKKSASEASKKVVKASSSKDITSSQAGNPQMKKSASVQIKDMPNLQNTRSSQAANPHMKKSASVHGADEFAEASKKVVKASSSKGTTSSQAGNPQMKKSASVQEDAQSGGSNYPEFCHGTLEKDVQASLNYHLQNLYGPGKSYRTG